jgi:hypothetical protein
MLNDLQRVLEQGTRTEQAAAMLALHQSPDTKAHALMQTLPSLSSVVTSGEFNWQSLAAAV